MSWQELVGLNFKQECEPGPMFWVGKDGSAETSQSINFQGVYHHLVPPYPQAWRTLQSSYLWGGVVACSLPSPHTVSKHQVFASADKCSWKIFKFIRQIVMKVTLMASKFSLPHHYGVLFFFLFVCPNSSYSCSYCPAKKVIFFSPHWSLQRYFFECFWEGLV